MAPKKMGKSSSGAGLVKSDTGVKGMGHGAPGDKVKKKGNKKGSKSSPSKTSEESEDEFSPSFRGENPLSPSNEFDVTPLRHLAGCADKGRLLIFPKKVTTF